MSVWRSARAGLGQSPSLQWTIPTTCHELVISPALSAVLPAPWRAAPGCVERFGSVGIAMHFAPARWLLLDVAAPSVDAALAAGAQSFDVTGKWQTLTWPGPEGARWLSAALDLPSILRGRACAATSLFDAPAIVAIVPTTSEYQIVVAASYTASISSSLRLMALAAGSSSLDSPKNPPL